MKTVITEVMRVYLQEPIAHLVWGDERKAGECYFEPVFVLCLVLLFLHWEIETGCFFSISFEISFGWVRFRGGLREGAVR